MVNEWNDLEGAQERSIPHKDGGIPPFFAYLLRDDMGVYCYACGSLLKALKTND